MEIGMEGIKDAASGIAGVSPFADDPAMQGEFPLTPALSLRERENRSQSFCESQPPGARDFNAST